MVRGRAAARATSRQESPTSPEQKAYNLRTAPTVLLAPAITEEMARAALGSAGTKAPRSGTEDLKATHLSLPPAKPAEDAPPAPQKAGGKRRKGFSETDWFLAPIDPKDVDAETGKVLVDPTKYERNTAIPDEKRRRFSLRREDEE